MSFLVTSSMYWVCQHQVREPEALAAPMHDIEMHISLYMAYACPGAVQQQLAAASHTTAGRSPEHVCWVTVVHLLPVVQPALPDLFYVPSCLGMHQMCTPF